MQKRARLISTFTLFLIISIILIFLLQLPFLTPVRSSLERLFVPLQRFVHISTQDVFTVSSDQEITALELENQKLRKQLVDQQLLVRDAKALRDQFVATTLRSQRLLPATIVGAGAFIPGSTHAEKLLIDTGREHGVKNGMAVVYQDSIVGRITKTSQRLAVVTLLTNQTSAITSMTSKTQALGVVKGTDEDTLLLDNVILSETLEIGDVVLSKGDIDESGLGYPKDLIIGKITSIHREPSALFQTAEVKSLLNLQKLSTVFVITSL